ncbi:MAG: DUF3047 domain-containing protein [Nitrospirae bacterium]|nr:DUF3047 domain-containing protein [Candidatus Manganitrophaceae bacterium]
MPKENIPISNIVFILFVLMSFMSGFSGIIQAAEPIDLLQAGSGEDGLPTGWQPLVFKKIERHTEYKLSEESGRIVIEARSNNAASGLTYPLNLDSRIYQSISWCWKISRTIKKGDVTRKKGDDYAARIYVTFKFNPEDASFWERTKFKTYKLLYGQYPPKGALNYVWANKMKKGDAAPNAYTDRAHMIAIESGSEKVGQWVCEERNLYTDYRQYFGGTPPYITGIAVMTDTDNTGESTTAAYSNLVLKSKP